MKLNFSSRSKTILQVFFFFLNLALLDSVNKKSDTCNVQSDLDLHCMEKVIIARLAVQGLIYLKLKDVLSDLWWYYE